MVYRRSAVSHIHVNNFHVFYYFYFPYSFNWQLILFVFWHSILFGTLLLFQQLMIIYTICRPITLYFEILTLTPLIVKVIACIWENKTKKLICSRSMERRGKMWENRKNKNSQTHVRMRKQNKGLYSVKYYTTWSNSKICISTL